MLQIFSINKYHKMSDAELEKEASKWNIRGYGNNNGTIERDIIIDALIKKDQANLSQVSLTISFIALVVSIISIYK